MGRAGTVELPTGDLGAQYPTRWFPVASVEDPGKPKARTVRVRVSKTAALDVLHSSSLTAGGWWAPDDTFSIWHQKYHGVLRFEYGYEGMLRTLFCDLRSGEYQVPPCEFVRLTATRWTPAVDIIGEFPVLVDLTPYQVEGEISDGVAADFSPMLFTMPSFWWKQEDNWQQNKVAVPPGAYAFDVYPDLAIASGFGPGASRFQVSNPAAVRDFGAGDWYPPGPLPLIEDSVTITVPDGDPAACCVVFFVR
jgi:hypothetical protein